MNEHSQPQPAQRRMRFPLTEQRIEEAVSAYQNGESLHTVCRDILHRDGGTARALLEERGVIVRQRKGYGEDAPKPRFNWREVAAVRAVLSNGISPTTAGRVYGVDASRVETLAQTYALEML